MALHVAAGVKTYHRRDQAEDPLFSWVDPTALQRPTYHTFIQLLDNYESGTGEAEVVTPEEEQENRNFLDECMKTKVWVAIVDMQCARYTAMCVFVRFYICARVHACV